VDNWDEVSFSTTILCCVLCVCDRERDRELWDGRASVKVVCCWEKVPKMVFFPYQVRGRFNCLSLYLS
jgi:hypothetical protein